MITVLWQRYEPQLSVPQLKFSQLNYNDPYWSEMVLEERSSRDPCVSELLLRIYRGKHRGLNNSIDFVISLLLVWVFCCLLHIFIFLLSFN